MKFLRGLSWLVVVGLVGNTPTALLAQNPFAVNQTYCTTSASPCVLTYHNNNNRDGSNPNETNFSALTLATKNPVGVARASTDGLIFAQPLYIHQMQWSDSKKHNIVYVATENNSVYAFDADTGSQLGVASLNNGTDISATETAIPWTDLPNDASRQPCNTVVPEVGITGTPVIDVSVTPPALYFVSTHKDYPTGGSATYRQKLHVLRADNLVEPTGSPVILNFAGSNFDPLVNMQRAGLTLLSPPSLGDTANVWVTWGSHCDSTTDSLPWIGY